MFINDRYYYQLMEIKIGKNLRFKDQPIPVVWKNVEQEVQSRKAIKTPEPIEMDFSFFSSTDGIPKGKVITDQENQLKIRLENFIVGRHVFPKNIELKEVPTLDKLEKPLETSHFIPDHLDVQPNPGILPQDLVTPVFFKETAGEDDKFGYQATTVFPPDDRTVLNSTSYPWSCFGRVDTPLGFGSGVMIGPRHLLTVSHVIQWNNDNTAGWVRFRPAFFAPSAPFGEAWGNLTYYKAKVQGPTIDWYEGMYDYVCVVLDRYLGNSTGWLGARGYTDAWDGTAYWAHVGYPSDLTAGNRPICQTGISLDGSFWEFDSHESMSHRGDVWPGQSGGPFFAWWSDGPYAIAVQSGQTSSENTASGGQDLVDLVIQARNEHP